MLKLAGNALRNNRAHPLKHHADDNRGAYVHHPFTWGLEIS